jgi:biopolymer transport protein ExbD
MSRLITPWPGAVLGLAWGVLATALCGFALGVLLLPQRLLQQPLHQGVLTLHVGADEGLWLWHQPISRSELEPFLRAAAHRRPGIRLRVVPDPQLPWGTLQNLLQQLHQGPLPLELQLPTAKR